MKICMMCEGSYPYILGGVSSWVNNLIKACPEHEFIIYSIAPEKSMKGKYKYELPSNVKKVHTVFLDGINLSSGKAGKHLRLSKDEEKVIYDMLNFEGVDWDKLFHMFSSKKIHNITDFFMSRNFFSIVKELYEVKFPYTPFTDFLWTMRSMYLAFFFILIDGVPEADLYHSVSCGYTGMMGAYAKSVKGKPYILSEHGIYTREREEEIIKATWVKGYYKDLWIKYFYSFSDCSYSFADKVTTLFERNKELQLEIGCPEEKLQIIPNGVDLSRFENLPTKEDENDINIGAIVRVVPIKDLKTMIKAFDVVKKKIPRAKFYIMGPTTEDEEYYEECVNLIDFLRLKDCVLTGSVNITDYIGKMDVMVLTSISEGQPLSIIEGMAAKKPHVSTNVGDCKGLLFGSSDDLGGQCGFVEGIMDVNGLANSIIKLALNPGLRKKFGDVAYERVVANYKSNVFIDEFKRIYNKYGSD